VNPRDQPASVATLVAILIGSIALDVGWARVRARRAEAPAAWSCGR